MFYEKNSHFPHSYEENGHFPNHCGQLSSFIVHFTSTPLPRMQGGSIAWDFHVEFDFLGLGCDHAVLEQLEDKNL